MVIRAVLDTCVLYPFHLRDFLLTASSKRFALFLPFWSVGILGELAKHHPDRDSNPERVHKLMDAMSSHFPYAVTDVTESNLADAMLLDLPDKDDAHVIATAIAAKANWIVTDNMKDFPNSELSKIGIEAVRPAGFSQLIAKQYGSDVVKSVVSNMASRYQNPKRTLEYVVACLSEHQIVI